MSEQDETPVQDQGRGNSAFYACSVSFKTFMYLGSPVSGLAT